MRYWIILIGFLIFQTSILYANEYMVKIFWEPRKDIINEEYILIYQGTPSMELINNIKKAHVIRFGNIEKTVVTEGQYIIEFFDKGEQKRFSIQNNFWIYDINLKKYLRCSILNNMRGYLLDFLFKNSLKSE